MVHLIIEYYVLVSIILGFFFLLIGKPVWNLILLIICIPFENTLEISSFISLIKAMTILTFLSMAIHRKDFISFIFDKLIMNKFFLVFVGIFIASSLFSIEKSAIIGEVLGWIQWLLILVFIWYACEREDRAIGLIEKSLIGLGIAILFMIFVVQGFSNLSTRLFLARFLNPNTLAVVFTGLSVVAYGVWAKSRSKIVAVILLTFLLSIILTGNRSVPVGFFIYLVSVFFLSYKINKLRVFAVTTVLIVLFLIIPFQRDSFLFNARERVMYTFKQMYELVVHKETTISAYEESYHTSLYRSSRIDSDARWLMYQEALNIFLKNPIVGSGPGNTLFDRTIFRVYQRPKGMHSNVSEIMLYFGLFGFVFMIFLVITLFRFSSRWLSLVESKQFLFLLIVFFIDGLFHVNYLDSVIVMFLAFAGFRLRRAVQELPQEDTDIDELSESEMTTVVVEL
jgi:O-antigen ligase